MSVFFLILFIFLFNLIFFLKFNSISNFLVLFDKPDGKLKRHSKPISLIGGLVIITNIYLIIFLSKLFDIDSIFEGHFLYTVIILSTLFYLVGLIDDLKNLSPNIKLLLLIFSISIVIYFFPEIKLDLIKISFFEKVYYFHEYSYLFVILSFLLLANAINMFDGINLQLILFSSLIFMLFILKGFIPIFFISLLICLTFLGILNYQNKVFLGDSGAFLISSLLGCTFIYQYKNLENFFFGDEVFVILIIPAIDMLRLFIERSINKKHPFKGDLNHLHHIIYNFTKNKNLTIIITIGSCVIPTLFLFLDIETYYIFTTTIILYLILITYMRKKNK